MKNALSHGKYWQNRFSVSPMMDWTTLIEIIEEFGVVCKSCATGRNSSV